LVQPAITNYQNYHKDDLLPVAAAATTTTTTTNPNVNIADSQTINHASTTKATTTTIMTARMVTEANQQGTTESITVHISGINSQPLSYSDILQLIISRGTDVITKYLPCVDFLVLCQQELRKAVERNQKVPTKQRYSPKQVRLKKNINQGLTFTKLFANEYFIIIFGFVHIVLFVFLLLLLLLPLLYMFTLHKVLCHVSATVIGSFL
jgi:hypothetical protein